SLAPCASSRRQSTRAIGVVRLARTAARAGPGRTGARAPAPVGDGRGRPRGGGPGAPSRGRGCGRLGWGGCAEARGWSVPGGEEAFGADDVVEGGAVAAAGSGVAKVGEREGRYAVAAVPGAHEGEEGLVLGDAEEAAVGDDGAANGAGGEPDVTEDALGDRPAVDLGEVVAGVGTEGGAARPLAVGVGLGYGVVAAPGEDLVLLKADGGAVYADAGTTVVRGAGCAGLA